MYYNQITRNRDRQLEGKFITIPSSFNKLNKLLPGFIDAGIYVLLTGSTKSAKSSMFYHEWVLHPIQWILDNPEKGLNYTSHLCTLEISKQAIALRMMCHYLTRYGIHISPDDLLGKFAGKVLPEEYLPRIKEAEEWYTKLSDKFIVRDDINTADKFIQWIKDIAMQHGTMENGVYTPHDPWHIVNISLDHLSLIGDKADMEKVSLACIRARDKFNFNICIIQQQANAQESVTNVKLNLLRPSGSGLDKHKDTQKDCSLFIGMFNPQKYETIRTWNGIDMTEKSKHFGRYREASIILNRNGSAGHYINLEFDGPTNTFKEI